MLPSLDTRRFTTALNSAGILKVPQEPGFELAKTLGRIQTHLTEYVSSFLNTKKQYLTVITPIFGVYGLASGECLDSFYTVLEQTIPASW